MIEIDTEEAKRGPGYWKLNDQYLNDLKYCNLIIETVKSVLRSFAHLDDMRLWEMIKFEIGNVSQEFALSKGNIICIVYSVIWRMN